MSRRHQLKVDTFPFLAVLLCAMGSLILVLLVMDRRSKLAARQRVAEQSRRQTEEYAAARKHRRDEYEAKKRAQQAAWNKKRDALRVRVHSEETALDAELSEVQARLAEAAKKLRAEEENVRALRGQLREEQGRLAAQQKELAGARDEAKSLAGRLSDADKARAKLAADLAQLEALVATMKEARQRDAQTYSVIPYNGKRGDNRRPLYVECSEAGMVFHPDKLKLDAPAPESLRAEVKKRLARQAEELAAEGAKDARAYILLLVRPNGILRHYEMQAVARELGIDFGYEFVDADWVLTVPEKGKQVVKETVTPPLPRLPGPEAVALGPAAAASAAGAGTGAGGGSTPTPPPAPAGGRQGSGSLPGVGISAPQPYSASAGGAGAPAAAPGLETGGPKTARPTAQGQVAPHPDGPVAGVYPPAPRPSGGEPAGLELPPILPNPSPGGPAGAPQGKAANTALSEGAGSPGGGGVPGFGPPQGPDARPVPMRPARISGADDTMIFVECRPDTVVVYPSRQQVSIDLLNHTPPHNPLTKAVNQVIAQRQARVQSGMAPARFHIRFLVHPGCELTYHRAYPTLETVFAPKSKYALTTDDNVARIVAGY